MMPIVLVNYKLTLFVQFHFQFQILQ